MRVNDYLPEKHMIRTTSRALVFKDGKLLIMKRRRLLTTGQMFEYIAIPGGSIEPGETPLETAGREVYEETGVKAVPEHVAIIQRLSDGCVHHYVWCRYVSGEPRLNPDSPEYHKHSEENYYEPLWLPLDQVTAEALHHEYSDIVRALNRVVESRGRLSQTVEL